MKFLDILFFVFILFFIDGNCFYHNRFKLNNFMHTSSLHRKKTKCYGIPKLFRWITDLYPAILESASYGIEKEYMNIDYFYLDMNGIIHSCTHGNSDDLVNMNRKQMFNRIFKFTDSLYKLIKPKKLMFLAIDGVAPRAKMNQQRSRRFRSSKEREALIADYVAKSGKLPDEESFDSNCITPGTDFMFDLSEEFKKWIEDKLKSDPFWKKGSEIVFSGPDVPGEGEHKIMDMIRTNQQSKKYKIGQHKHCMYGLDADLIMLSLVTHEPHFVLLREKINMRGVDILKYQIEDFDLLEINLLRQMLDQHFQNLKFGDPSSLLNQPQYPSTSSPLNFFPKSSSLRDKKTSSIELKNNPSTLQNQKSMQNATDDQNFFDLNRVIDDFVFMCFFVGNDFLPCIPHMDIADGSLNMLMNIYKEMMPTLGGYLTKKDQIHLPRLELFIQEASRREPLYFKQRATDDKEPEYATKQYRDHYYKTKFGIQPGDELSIRKVVESYVQGLVWVLKYYHQGCGSWTWFYPYLYSPLGSDLKNLSDISLDFTKGRPFTPLMQLLSVLPPQSGAFLPPPYKAIMTSPTSPMLQFYPKDFSVDVNGKKNSWESIVKIPFLSEALLLETVNAIDHANELSEREKSRNSHGKEYHYYPKK